MIRQRFFQLLVAYAALTFLGSCSASFWMSLASVLTTISVLIFK